MPCAIFFNSVQLGVWKRVIRNDLDARRSSGRRRVFYYSTVSPPRPVTWQFVSFENNYFLRFVVSPAFDHHENHSLRRRAVKRRGKIRRNHFSHRLRRTLRDDIIIWIGLKFHLRRRSVVEGKDIELYTLISAFFSGRYHRVPITCTRTELILLKYCANRLIRLLGLSSGKEQLVRQ